MNLTFLPPQNWQDFEKFLKGVVDVIWEQQGWQNYGRQGQSQAGIDLYGYDSKGNFVGIQCKKKNLTNSDGQLLINSLITEKLINDEIKSAETIKSPELNKLIFATTSSRDAKIQDIVKNIDNERRKNGKFTVEIWFWEDFQALIERHIQLMYWYYSDYLDKIQRYDKNIHILTMLRQAFTRPAFKRFIGMEESGADFIQAIKDTQEAITSGNLYNRRGDLLATSYPADKISIISWKDKIEKIYEQLTKIRALYLQGLKDKKIIEHPTCLEILDRHLSENFNQIRTVCLKLINEVLLDAKLDLVKSELL